MAMRRPWRPSRSCQSPRGTALKELWKCARAVVLSLYAPEAPEGSEDWRAELEASEGDAQGLRFLQAPGAASLWPLGGAPRERRGARRAHGALRPGGQGEPCLPVGH